MNKLYNTQSCVLKNPRKNYSSRPFTTRDMQLGNRDKKLFFYKLMLTKDIDQTPFWLSGIRSNQVNQILICNDQFQLLNKNLFL